MRQSLALAPLQEPVAGANIVARSNVERYLGLLDQQREVAAATVDIEPYLKDVKVDDAAVQAFYDANQTAFQVPEQVKIEYVMLSPDALGAQIAARPGGGEEAIRRATAAATRSRSSGRPATY